MFTDESVLSVACIADKHLGPVIGNFCCNYRLLEISRLPSHADMLTIELSKTFHQVTQLLRKTTEIILLKASGMFQKTF